MNRILLKIVLLSSILTMHAQENITPPILTFFIRPDSERTKIFDSQTLLHKAEKLGALERTILKSQLAPVITQGIFALYAGMAAYSDSNGQVIFPRKQTKNTVTLIVVPQIRPVFLTTTIIHHFIVSEKVTAEQYILTRHEGNPPYWSIEKQELAPSYRIPNLALIIFAKPSDIMMSAEDTITSGGPHLILPYLYVKPTINPALNALNFIKISKYFAPVKRWYRFAPERYGIIINP